MIGSSLLFLWRNSITKCPVPAYASIAFCYHETPMPAAEGEMP
jgi:hypothetical protein